eukprot:37313_1
MVKNWAPTILSYINTNVLALSLTFFIIVIIWYNYHSKVTNDDTVHCNWSSNQDFWQCGEGIAHSDVRKLCLSFVGIFMDTEILTHSEQCDLSSLLCSEFESKYYIHLSLLFRIDKSTLETFDKKVFYAKCGNGTKNVLILLRTQHNNVVGAFMSNGVSFKSKISLIKQWISIYFNPIQYSSDPHTFLFRIRSRHGLSATLFKPKQDCHRVSFAKDMAFGIGNGDFVLYDGLKCVSCCLESSVYKFDPVKFLGTSDYTMYGDTKGLDTECDAESMEAFCLQCF